MATFVWDLEAAGASAGDETTVTSANGGTDGPTSVNSVAGGTRVYDSATAPPSHSWSVRLATGATSGTSNMVWGSARIPDTSVGYFRIPFRFSSLAANRSIARVRATATQVLRVQHTSDGRLELRDSGNSVAGTGTVPMPTDEWIEVGIFADPGAASECRLRWWTWGAAVEDFEDEVVATDDFSPATTVNELTLGNVAAGANIPNYWVGAPRFSDAGWPGPVVTSVIQDADGGLTATGSLTAAADVVRLGTVALESAGALAAAGTLERVGTAGLPGLGSLAGSVGLSQAATTALGGVGSLAATAVPERAASAPLPAVGALSASGILSLPAAASLTGTAGLTGSAVAARSGSSGLAGSGGLAATGHLTVAGAAGLTGVGALTAVAAVVHIATASLAAAGELAGEASGPVVPGVHTAGGIRPSHGSGSARPNLTAGHSRPMLAASTSRG